MAKMRNCNLSNMEAGAMKDGKEYLDLFWGFKDSICYHCGVDSNAAGKSLLQCGKCKQAYYCSMKCLDEAFPDHRELCESFMRDPSASKAALIKPRAAFMENDENKPPEDPKLERKTDKEANEGGKIESKIESSRHHTEKTERESPKESKKERKADKLKKEKTEKSKKKKKKMEAESSESMTENDDCEKVRTSKKEKKAKKEKKKKSKNDKKEKSTALKDTANEIDLPEDDRNEDNDEDAQEFMEDMTLQDPSETSYLDKDSSESFHFDTVAIIEASSMSSMGMIGEKENDDYSTSSLSQSEHTSSTPRSYLRRCPVNRRSFGRRNSLQTTATVSEDTFASSHCDDSRGSSITWKKPEWALKPNLRPTENGRMIKVQRNLAINDPRILFETGKIQWKKPDWVTRTKSSRRMSLPAYQPQPESWKSPEQHRYSLDPRFLNALGNSSKKGDE